MKIKDSWQSSQKPANGPYSDPDEFRPQARTRFLGANKYYYLI
jgi:hypothetical protein